MRVLNLEILLRQTGCKLLLLGWWKSASMVILGVDMSPKVKGQGVFCAWPYSLK